MPTNNDNFENDSVNMSREDAVPLMDLYARPDYVKFMNVALCGLLEVTDDSDLSYSDGRQNVVQVQLMDAIAFTAHKQLEFHQRMLEQDAARYAKFLQTEFTAGNEISDQKDERFQEQLTRHQKALAIYEVLKQEAVSLYLNITGLPEWKPFTERTKPGVPNDKLAQAKLAELTKRFGPIAQPPATDKKAATA